MSVNHCRGLAELRTPRVGNRARHSGATRSTYRATAAAGVGLVRMYPPPPFLHATNVVAATKRSITFRTTRLFICILVVSKEVWPINPPPPRTVRSDCLHAAR